MTDNKIEMTIKYHLPTGTEVVLSHDFDREEWVELFGNPPEVIFSSSWKPEDKESKGPFDTVLELFGM